MHVIKFNLMISSTSSWVLDFGSSAHICTSIQGLIESKRLKEGDIILWIDNEVKIIVEAIDIYPLRLSSKFRLDLKNY